MILTKEITSMAENQIRNNLGNSSCFGHASGSPEASETEVWDDLWKTAAVPAWDGMSNEILSALVRECGDPSNKKWLEAGAGSGRISARLAKQGASVYLVDYSPAALELEKRVFEEEGVTGSFQYADIRNLPYEDCFFDIVWSAGVLEHYEYDDQVAMLSELLRVTKESGLVINIVPYAKSPFYVLGKWWAERSGNWPYGREVPLSTLWEHAKHLKATLVKEYTIASETSLYFLSHIPGFSEFLKAVSLAISIDPDLRSSIPGYLLVSILKPNKSDNSKSGYAAPITSTKTQINATSYQTPKAQSYCPTMSAKSVSKPPLSIATGPVQKILLDEGYKTIVCFSSTDWDFLKQRPQHLFEKFRDMGFRIIHINYTKARLQLDRSFTSKNPNDLLDLVRDQLLRVIREVEPGIFVVTPIEAIVDNSGKSVEVLRHFVNQVMRLFSPNKYICWILAPGWAPVLPIHSPNCLKVYDCVDEHSGFNPSPITLAREEAILRSSDVVFVTSQPLAESKRIAASSVYLVPNGVNRDTFRGEFPEPRDLCNIPHPRIGFVGAIARWVDLQLIRDLAANEPNWSIVLIGPSFTDTSCLNLPNIYMLGSKPYEQLPGYYRHLDCGIIPFKTDDVLAHNSNPIKLLEYMAAGLPVVSTPIPESKRMCPAVRVAEPSGFVAAIKSALSEKTAQRASDGSQFAPTSESTYREELLNALSWDHLAETACGIIASKLAASKNDFLLARHILKSILPHSVDKAAIHADIRLYARLERYWQGAPRTETETPHSPVIEGHPGHENQSKESWIVGKPSLTPLRIAAKLPYCMLLFPDWDNPAGPWVDSLKTALRLFQNNRRMTLAIRADPDVIPVDKAVTIISDLMLQATGPTETDFSDNVTIVGDRISPEQIDRLLLAVDAVIVPQGEEESKHLSQILQVASEIGVTLVSFLNEGARARVIVKNPRTSFKVER